MADGTPSTARWRARKPLARRAVRAPVPVRSPMGNICPWHPASVGAGRTILFGRRLPTPERAAREVEGAVRRRRRPREEGLAALTRGRQRRVDDRRPLDRHAGRRERIAPVPADHDEPEPAGRGTPAPHPYPYDA